MESLLNWGIDIIIWLQQASPSLDLVFRFITFFGDELFFLLFMPMIIWCVDYRRGVRLAILFLTSAYINSFAKAVIHHPRPFDFDPRAKKLVDAAGYGMPSGHTQNTVTIWGYMAARFKNRATWSIAAIMIVLIPLSRIYLGVHFPIDVIGGYLLGLVILLTYLTYEGPIVNWVQNRNSATLFCLAGVLPLLMVLIFPGEIMDSIPAGATLMGVSIGLLLAVERIEFCAGGDWWKRILRYLFGMVIISIFYFGLKLAFKNLEPAPVFRFIRYALVGFSIIFLVPWLSNIVKLSTPKNPFA